MAAPSSSIQATVGNESHHEGIALSKYTELEHSLFEPTKDDHVVVSTQSCFLPLTDTGDVDFYVGLFNYQSTHPAVLVPTDAGTRSTTHFHPLAIQELAGRAQVVCGTRRGDMLYFNDHGTKRTFQATWLSTDRSRRGVEDIGAMTAGEEARNYIMEELHHGRADPVGRAPASITAASTFTSRCLRPQEALAWAFDRRPSIAATQSVATLSRNTQTKAWAKACGLDIVNVSWENCARTKNSCWGPCISDMTLVVGSAWMSVLRAPNFSATVGNESHHEGIALSK
ncbi:hypothetical protein H310_15414, partial [Aphanomyces invadans]